MFSYFYSQHVVLFTIVLRCNRRCLCYPNRTKLLRLPGEFFGLPVLFFNSYSLSLTLFMSWLFLLFVSYCLSHLSSEGARNFFIILNKNINYIYVRQLSVQPMHILFLFVLLSFLCVFRFSFLQRIQSGLLACMCFPRLPSIALHCLLHPPHYNVYTIPYSVSPTVVWFCDHRACYYAK